VLAVTPKASPYDPQARALVQSLRHGQLHHELAGLTYQVGGETASSIDATQAMLDSLPRVLVVLLVVVGMLLLFALRSVLLPLKAIALVVLSLGASLGTLVLLATTSIGARLIGASGPGDIHPIVPITVVAITVALSTDYEVILIGRIRENYERTGANQESIVAGVGHTGGVITSAAGIMVAVFAGFAIADLPPLKQLGVGLAVAVLIDATVVRGILVPSAMAAMGKANWWWPRRLAWHREPAEHGRVANAAHVSTPGSTDQVGASMSSA
jgi:RND superfamily putative drug exporter